MKRGTSRPWHSVDEARQQGDNLTYGAGEREAPVLLAGGRAVYDVKPRGVFVHERVYENPRAVERMERMLAALGRSRHDVPTVGMGDLGYWPPGTAFCLFFGPTPMSRGQEIRPASAVNIFGRIIGDPTVLKQVASGADITVEEEGA